ncbi:hypothetical protein ACVMH6_001967 [Rhizobium leguminosarum]
MDKRSAPVISLFPIATRGFCICVGHLFTFSTTMTS